MAAKKSERVNLVIQMAAEQENAAAQALQHAQQEELAARQRLMDLKAYYAEYDKRFQSQTQALRGADLAHARGFLANLSDACRAQTLLVAQCERKVEEARQQWQQAHLKTDNLERYQSRCRDDEQRVEDRREQKLLDEHAARKR